MNRMARIGILAALMALAVFGGYQFGRRPAASQATENGHAAKHEYTCPMHPFVIKDKPGACPVCAMELVRKIAGAELSEKDVQGIRHVALSPTQQVMANLATAVAAVKPFSREIRCTGIVAYNQERQAKVSSWITGRIDNLLVKSVGSEVRKDRPVAEIYSVDLYNAQVQYLMAYKTVKILNSTVSATFPINTHMSLGDAHDRLRLLGFREEQFEKLQKLDKPTVHIPIYSPFSGVVTEKLVKEGQYVNVGDPLFSIADLSRIWVELEVFESDFPQVKVGQDVSIRSRSYPGELFRGKVKLIYPFLDAKTRTVKLRVEIPNPGQKLKPEMYVQASISVPQSPSLVVPAAAVMDTGSRQVVWVESGPGVFVQREVKAGGRSGREIQILSGLKVGEKVAVTGGYLVDSEAQLSRGAEEAEKPAAVPASSAAPAVRKDDLDMKEMKMN